MKTAILAIALFAALVLPPTPAPAETRPPPEMRAMNAMLLQCYGREANAVAHDVGLQDQIEALAKQVADLTRERDALKGEKAPP